MMIRACRHDHDALPPPPAQEGWGEGVSTGKNLLEERALTLAFGSTSPAKGER